MKTLGKIQILNLQLNLQLDAEFPFADGWSLTGHVAHLNVTAEIDPNTTGYIAPYNGERSPDYTDYKIAVAKSFSLAGSEGWAYVGANDSVCWQADGWGGSSFNGHSQTADLSDDRLVVTISRGF